MSGETIALVMSGLLVLGLFMGHPLAFVLGGTAVLGAFMKYPATAATRADLPEAVRKGYVGLKKFGVFAGEEPLFADPETRAPPRVVLDRAQDRLDELKPLEERWVAVECFREKALVCARFATRSYRRAHIAALAVVALHARRPLSVLVVPRAAAGAAGLYQRPTRIFARQTFALDGRTGREVWHQKVTGDSSIRSLFFGQSLKLEQSWTNQRAKLERLCVSILL